MVNKDTETAARQAREDVLSAIHHAYECGAVDEGIDVTPFLITKWVAVFERLDPATGERTLSRVRDPETVTEWDADGMMWRCMK